VVIHKICKELVKSFDNKNITIVDLYTKEQIIGMWGNKTLLLSETNPIRYIAEKKQCKHIKIRIGDKKTIVIDRQHKPLVKKSEVIQFLEEIPDDARFEVDFEEVKSYLSDEGLMVEITEDAWLKFRASYDNPPPTTIMGQMTMTPTDDNVNYKILWMSKLYPSFKYTLPVNDIEVLDKGDMVIELL